MKSGLFRKLDLKLLVAWGSMIAAGGFIAVSLAPGLIGRSPSPSESAVTLSDSAVDWPSRSPMASDRDDRLSEPPLYAAISPDGALGDDPLPPSALDADAATSARRFAGSAPEGRFDCLIESKQLVDVGSSVTGVIEAVYADRSDFVEANQVLAELESDVEKAAVEIARLRADMKGDVEANRVSAKLGRKREARARRLFAANAVSIEEREETETEAELAQYALLRAREQKTLAEAELQKALEVLERRKIRSPISGVVVERLKLPGEVVKEEKVMTIAQIDPLRAEVVLPAALFGSVTTGMRAEVLPELPEAGVHIATVGAVDRVIDAASGTFRVRLELPNPDRALPSGLHCQARFMPSE